MYSIHNYLSTYPQRLTAHELALALGVVERDIHVAIAAGELVPEVTEPSVVFDRDLVAQQIHARRNGAIPYPHRQR
jgi:hypothetical protein